MPPSPPPGHAVTPLRDLWLPVTVHVAWTLVKRGYTVTPALLADAREHLLRGIDPTLTVDQVEWLSAAWTDDYLSRRVSEKVQPPPVPGPEVFIPAAAWRDHLLEDADRGMQAVFRFVYAEGLPLDKAARHLRCAPRTLEAAQSRLRTAVRARLTACTDWTADTRDTTVDTVLRRLATLAAPGAPGPLGLMSPAGLAHAESCPRTSRAVRLIKRGHLGARALFPPQEAKNPASGTITVVGLNLHPDARRHARHIEALLDDRAASVGPGTWLVPLEHETALYEGLVSLCEKGRPARHHIRAARSEGSGRWAGRTLLGPVATTAIDAARAAPWGDVCGRPALPLPAPPPPSAHRWWAGALVTAAATIALGIAIAQPEPVLSPTPVHAHFLPAQDGWDVSFDVPDTAVLDVVIVEDNQVRIIHRSLRSARGAWSTGYGEFRTRLPGDQVALIASPRGLDDLERLVLDAAEHPAPLDALEQMMHSAHPRADIARSRPPVATAELAGPIVSPL